jgi:hypothetical protein
LNENAWHYAWVASQQKFLLLHVHQIVRALHVCTLIVCGLQNVAIQMGLRLVSKGGAEIKALHRSVLRCEGCATICKSQSKVFCPACGHATLSKVAVTVAPDGTEHIGVRKRFTLRGTRCLSPPLFPPNCSTVPLNCFCKRSCLAEAFSRVKLMQQQQNGRGFLWGLQMSFPATALSRTGPLPP